LDVFFQEGSSLAASFAVLATTLQALLAMESFPDSLATAIPTIRGRREKRNWTAFLPLARTACVAPWCLP
jgi:hypothetical protein